MWTNHERQAAQERAFEEKGGEYILPIRIDETVIPGLPKTIGYIDIDEGIDRICELLVAKVRGVDCSPAPLPSASSAVPAGAAAPPGTSHDAAHPGKKRLVLLVLLAATVLAAGWVIHELAAAPPATNPRPTPDATVPGAERATDPTNPAATPTAGPLDSGIEDGALGAGNAGVVAVSCDSPPSYTPGGVDLRLGTTPTQAQAELRLADLRTLLRDMNGASWKGRLGVVNGTDDGGDVKVMIVTHVDKQKGEELCRWLQNCTSWRPGPSGCGIREREMSP